MITNTDPQDSDSDDDGYSDGIEQSEETDPNSAADYPIRLLVVLDPENGSVSGEGAYALGTAAILRATPDLGYLFASWTGDITSGSNRLEITLLQNLSIGASFDEDSRDLDQDGLTNYEELVLFETDPNDPDSDDDGFNDGFEVANNTDLRSASSRPLMDLHVSVSKVNDSLLGVFSITPPVGGIIAIEETRDLKTWTQVETFSGDGQPFTKTILPSGKGVYYRLRLIDQSQ